MSKSILLSLIPAMLAGCAGAVDSLDSDEALLAAAGFRALYPRTADRIDQLYSLPPGHLLADNAGDHVDYLYADPAHCGCYYQGDDAAHERLKKLLAEKGRADAQLQASLWQLDQSMNYGMMYGGMYGGGWGPW